MVASRGLTATWIAVLPMPSRPKPAKYHPRAQSAPRRHRRRHQPRDGEAVAQKRRGLAAPAVHQRRDRSREHQKPEENHRRQEAHGGLLSGQFDVRPVIGATMSQKPMMKKPCKHGSSNRLSTCLRSSETKFRVQIFQSTFFSAKRVFRQRLFLTPLSAARRRSNKQNVRDTQRRDAAHAKKAANESTISPPHEKTLQNV